MKKKRFVYLAILILIVINLVAFNHAWHFTHFDEISENKTSKPEELEFFQKIKVLLTGISNPRPENSGLPLRNYETINIKTHHDYVLEIWQIKLSESIGTVILFHGYTGEKSDLLEVSEAFIELGYNTVLVDFYGSGGSSGSSSTIGYYESEDVKNVYNYVKEEINGNVILFGSSMGAVSILKALADHGIKPNALILECPYGRLITTVKNRFKLMGLPTVVFPELLVFWGGVQQGYWPFSMNAIIYAEEVEMPTLILHGKNDKRANLEDVEAIYSNLSGKKKMVLFENTGHESYIGKYKNQWTSEVSGFLVSRTKQ